MDTILKFSPVIAVLAIMLLFLFMRCTAKNNETGSKAHAEVVRLHQLANKLYSEEQKTVSKMQNIQEKMLTSIDTSSITNAAHMKTALGYNNIIAKCKGILKKHSLILLQHEQYINRHEDTALDAGEIIAQHQQIKEDYFTVKLDAQYIKEQFNKLEIDQSTIAVVE